MPFRSNRKGFYAVTPLIGTIMFTLAAGMALLIASESDAAVDLASASDIQGRLLFISEAILTDSFNNLIQNELERLTIDFLANGQEIELDPELDWRANFKDALERKIRNEMGEALGIDLEAYSKAYRNLPGMGGCEVVRRGETYMFPTVSASPEDDGTVINRVFSFGEQINCTSIDPPGETLVDIYGKYYHMNVRVIRMLQIASEAIRNAEAVISGVATDIVSGQEIVGTMSSSRWMRVVSDLDNSIHPAFEGAGMQQLMDDWKAKGEFLEGRIKEAIRQQFFSPENAGLTLESLQTSGLAGNLTINDFDVACVGDETVKNCASRDIEILLGEPDCASRGMVNLNLGGPFFDVGINDIAVLEGFTPVRTTLKAENNLLKKELFGVLGYVCIDLDTTVYSGGYGVCKEWEGRPSEMTFTGTVSDDNPKYVPGANDKISFNFRSKEFRFGETEEKLQCKKAGEGQERFKSYLSIMLGYLKIGFAYDQVSGSWRDRDSGFTPEGPEDEWMFDIYRDTSQGNKLPVVDFDQRNSNVASAVPQGIQESDWKVGISIAWNGFMSKCTDPEYSRRRCDLHCRSIYGDSSRAIRQPSNVQTYCESIAKLGAARTESAFMTCYCDEGNVKVAWSGIALEMTH